MSYVEVSIRKKKTSQWNQTYWIPWSSNPWYIKNRMLYQIYLRGNPISSPKVSGTQNTGTEPYKLITGFLTYILRYL